jgi:flagellar hook assembly protein FlgD
MKKINSPLFSIFMLLFCVLSVQSVFAVEVPLKKETTGQSTQTKSTSVLPVSVSINDTQLGISFSKSVGVVNITIEDQTGNVVYQDVLDTNSTRTTSIETGGFDSGNYTVNISYSTTILIGDFQL